MCTGALGVKQLMPQSVADLKYVAEGVRADPLLDWYVRRDRASQILQFCVCGTLRTTKLQFEVYFWERYRARHGSI